MTVQIPAETPFYRPDGSAVLYAGVPAALGIDLTTVQEEGPPIPVVLTGRVYEQRILDGQGAVLLTITGVNGSAGRVTFTFTPDHGTTLLPPGDVVAKDLTHQVGELTGDGFQPLLAGPLAIRRLRRGMPATVLQLQTGLDIVVVRYEGAPGPTLLETLIASGDLAEDADEADLLALLQNPATIAGQAVLTAIGVAGQAAVTAVGDQQTTSVAAVAGAVGVAVAAQVPPAVAGAVAASAAGPDGALYVATQAGATAVEAAGTTQTGLVNTAGGTQVAAVEAAGTTQTGLVNTAGGTQVAAVEAAGTTQAGLVNTTGGTQVSAVEAAGATQTAGVNATGAARLAEIVAATGADAYESKADALAVLSVGDRFVAPDEDDGGQLKLFVIETGPVATALWSYASEADVARNKASLTTVIDQVIGRAATPVTGTRAGSNRTRVLGVPRTTPGVLEAIEMFVMDEEEFVFHRWTRTGTTDDKVVGSDVSLGSIPVGLQRRTRLEGHFPRIVFDVDEFPGFYDPRMIASRVVTPSPTEPWRSNTGNLSQLVNMTTVTNQVLEIRFEFSDPDAGHNPDKLALVTADVELLKNPVIETPIEADMVLGLGQSFMVGQALAPYAAAPQAETAWMYKNATGTVVPLADPTGNDTGSSLGSFFPVFATEYVKLTGVAPVVVNAGKNSTGFTGGGTTNWSSTGTLLAAALASYDDAKEYATQTLGLSLRSTVVLYDMGYADATSGLSAATMTGHFNDFKAAIRAHLGATVPIIINLLGSNHAVDDTNFAVVRKWQRDMAAADPYVDVAFAGTYDFEDAGLLKDQLHPNKGGNDIIGVALARAAARRAGQCPVLYGSGEVDV